MARAARERRDDDYEKHAARPATKPDRAIQPVFALGLLVPLVAFAHGAANGPPYATIKQLPLAHRRGRRGFVSLRQALNTRGGARPAASSAQNIDLGVARRCYCKALRVEQVLLPAGLQGGWAFCAPHCSASPCRGRGSGWGQALNARPGAIRKAGVYGSAATPCRVRALRATAAGVRGAKGLVMCGARPRARRRHAHPSTRMGPRRGGTAMDLATAHVPGFGVVPPHAQWRRPRATWRRRRNNDLTVSNVGEATMSPACSRPRAARGPFFLFSCSAQAFGSSMPHASHSRTTSSRGQPLDRRHDAVVAVLEGM